LSVLDRILQTPELVAEPPVLVDVGAASGVHAPWRRIAKYSICVAFEADDRDLESVTSEAAAFRRLTTFNCIAAERASDAEPFHLTVSPHCSSRLPPRLDQLQRYAFAPLFRVERTLDVRARDIPSALEELSLDRIDWLKVDTQGTDLRLFRSLDEKLAARTLVVELEPGIIDAYEGEDRLEDVLREMHTRGFWVSNLRVRGSTRIDADLARRALGDRAAAYLDAAHKPAPGWVEIEYFNAFDGDAFDKRDLLLGCAFAFMRRHHAFAYELATRGLERYDAPPFDELRSAALARMKAGLARVPFSIAGSLLRR
jgi:FkbM family methyltransferase